MNADILSKINAARAERRAAVLVTDMETGAQKLVLSNDIVGGALGDEIARRLKSGKSGLVEIEGAETFVQVHVPSPRLVIIGAVHISQALVPMATVCGFDVTVIDPRTAFASTERFGDVALHADWPEVVLRDIPLDAYTALVAVTHDPKIDDFALKSALETGCFYIGALGSKKTHAKRVARFIDDGVDESQLARIHAPIGLDIAAASPAEIAVAIIAQIIETLRKGAVA